MKNQDIERLRGIAIFSVLLQHLSITSSIMARLELQPENMPFYLGVELFFLISGYVVTKSFLSKGLNLRLFYFKRLFRIMPLLIFVVFITTLINTFKSFAQVPWETFISESLAVLGGYYINLPQKAAYFYGAMWSLSVEMQFYLFFPILILVASKISQHKHKTFLITFSALYFLLLLARFSAAYLPEIITPDFLQHLTFFKFDFLILGILVYFLEHRFKHSLAQFFRIRRSLLRILTLSLILLAGVISYHMGSPFASIQENPLLHSFGYLIIGILFFFVMQIAALDKDILIFHPIADRLISYLGSRSYSLYVLHLPALVISWFIINQRFPAFFHLSPIYYGIFQAILFIAIGIPLAEVSFRYIEKPGIRLGEMMIEKLNLKKIRNS